MKKVLIITYYWPPAGGPGVQRWLKFVNYLPQFDIDPIVYIPSNPTYPIIDFNLEKEVPKNIKVIKHSIFEPYALAQKIGGKKSNSISTGIIPPVSKQNWQHKLLLFIRGNLFIPDARKFWVKPSVRKLSKFIEEEKIETIITTGPPHSVHLIGKQLKEKLKIHWIADFRDPWTSIGYHKQLKLSNYAQKKHIKLEQEVLTVADQLIVTSKGTKNEFDSKINNTPIHIITNGFEPKQMSPVDLDTDFSISHIGSLLSERNPVHLWESLAELVQENELFATHFKLKLAGVVSETILEILNSLGLSKNIMLLGYVSHSEALKLQQISQVLLLIEINSNQTQMIIPGKLFEYLSSTRPILAIGPQEADFSTIIKETKTGSFFNYEEKDAIKQQIMRYFNDFWEEKLIVNPIGIEKYTRKSLTATLAKVISN